jgi:hypothetical protein
MGVTVNNDSIARDHLSGPHEHSVVDRYCGDVNVLGISARPKAVRHAWGGILQLAHGA